MKKNQNLLKFVIFIVFIILVILLINFLNLESILSINKIQTVINGYGIFAPIAFIILYILLTIIFFPGTLISIASGILFGTVFGTLYVIIGATIGATLSFIISRYFARNFTQKLIEKKFKKIDKYNKKIEKNGFITVLFLRLIPLFPFNGLNFTLGLTKVKLKDYILATLIGIIPGVFVITYFGDSLISNNLTKIIIATSLFALLILILPIYNYIKKLKGGKVNEKK